MSKNVEINKLVMADYLDRIGEGLILVSKEPLSYDWTPPELVGRGEELRELASMFLGICLLYTSPSPRDLSTSRMPSSA